MTERWKKVTAIVRRERLEAVEEALVRAGAGGLTVTAVKGFGETANFLRHDWLVEHVRVEVFATEADTSLVAEAIARAAHTSSPGDGLVAILPVDCVVRIRSGEPCRLAPRAAADPAPSAAAPDMTPGSRGLAIAIVLLGVIGFGAAIVVASKHQLHYLVALLTVLFALTAWLGARFFRPTERRRGARPENETGEPGERSGGDA